MKLSNEIILHSLHRPSRNATNRPRFLFALHAKQHKHSQPQQELKNHQKESNLAIFLMRITISVGLLEGE